MNFDGWQTNPNVPVKLAMYIEHGRATVYFDDGKGNGDFSPEITAAINEYEDIVKALHAVQRQAALSLMMAGQEVLLPNQLADKGVIFNAK